MAFVRVFLIAGGAIVIASAAFFAVIGDYRFALATALLGGGILLLATWAWGHPTAFPARQWVGLGLVAAGFAVQGLVLLAIGFLLVIFLLSVGSSRLLLRRLSHTEFEQVGPEEAMPEAEPLVVELEADGFRRAGGYRWRIPVHRKVVTATVLEGPDGDCFAVVTDRVWEVVSRFGARWLVTTSSGLSPLPNSILVQTLPRGRPAELVQAHRGAVELLAGRGLEAERFDGAAVVDAARAMEEDAIRFVSSAPLKRIVGIETRRTSDNPVLAEDERSRRRIDAWLDSQEPI